MLNSDLIQDSEWKKLLEEEFSKPYMLDLGLFLDQERGAGKVIYPPEEQIFACLNRTSFSKVRVVILGQDPYHGDGEAHGLSFSVPLGIKTPSSLRNIFKELNTDLGISVPTSGNLDSWAEQGVLLLNDVLTVVKDTAHAHKKQGWEIFTSRIIELLNEQRNHLVFILWGAHAQKKGEKIDRQRHFVISSAHPSGLSAYRGFIGSRPFSRANSYLKEHTGSEIRWNLR